MFENDEIISNGNEGFQDNKFKLKSFNLIEQRTSSPIIQ